MPTELLDNMIQWNHHTMGHCGATWLYNLIQTIFYHPQLKAHVDAYRCPTCQQHKSQGRAHDHLPEQEALFLPFEEDHIDLIGPWKVQVG